MSTSRATEESQPDSPGPAEALDPRVIATLQAEVPPETVRKILLTALIEMRERKRDCLAALRDAEPELLRQAAHALGAISDVVGAGLLAAKAREIEIMAAQVGLPPNQVVEELERLVGSAILAVGQRLERHHARG
jgi:HPt (histidine-containing phosphotransfer) domain-containing protein